MIRLWPFNICYSNVNLLLGYRAWEIFEWQYLSSGLVGSDEIPVWIHHDISHSHFNDRESIFFPWIHKTKSNFSIQAEVLTGRTSSARMRQISVDRIISTSIRLMLGWGTGSRKLTKEGWPKGFPTPTTTTRALPSKSRKSGTSFVLLNLGPEISF